VKPGRRDEARRLTPETIAIYARKAHALRAQAYREAVWAVWAWLKRLIGRG
jgi:hypothetical protein